MTIIMQDFDASIPTWALGLLFNGNEEGLSESDIDQALNWQEEMLDSVGATSALYDVIDSTEHFDNYPEFGKPTTCLTVRVTPIQE